MNPKISIIYTTARRDCPMLGRPNDHQFDVFLNSVKKQSMDYNDFEVIIVDLLKDRVIKNPAVPMFNNIGPRQYDFSKYDFTIKHIAPSPTWWLDNGCSSYCHCVNAGIIAADGELIILFDDCSEIMSNDSLEIHWDLYKRGNGKQFPRSIYEYWIGGRPRKHAPDCVPHPTLMGKIIRQGDYDWLVSRNLTNVVRDNFCAFGYYSFPLELMLDFNGYNEMFDGVKGAEDFDMGCRLIDYGCKSIFDIRLRVIEHVHEPFVFHMMNPHWKRCNVGTHLTLLKRGHSWFRANAQPLTQQEYDEILQYHIEKVKDFKETPEFKRLLTDPPIFDMRQLRKEYRDGLCQQK